MRAGPPGQRVMDNSDVVMEALRNDVPARPAKTPAEVPCPCGKDSAVVITLRAGQDITSCRRCGLLARFPLPDQAGLETFYRDEYWTRYPEEQAGPARHNLYRHALAWIEDAQAPPGTLVDVGCGMGALLVLSRERGWRAIGVDPSSAAVARARAGGLEALEEAWPHSSLPDGTVDVVTFVNVLDHLPNPFAALEKAWCVLKPGGLVYIRVPNAPLHAALTRMLSRIGWEHLTIMHLYGFGRSALLHHLRRLGFSTRALRAAPPSQGDAYSKEGEARYPVRMRLKFLYQQAHYLLARTGLDGWGWGLSLEVIASKVVGEARAGARAGVGARAKAKD